jgi:hypothetical protein
MATPDDPLAAKMAEGMRSTSARGRHSFGYFSSAVGRKVTRPTGRNQKFQFTKKIIKAFAQTPLQQETSNVTARNAIRD